MESIVTNFKVPSAEERKRSLGAMGGTSFKVKKSIEDVDQFWLPKTPPGPSEWLYSQFESGQGFDVIF